MPIEIRHGISPSAATAAAFGGGLGQARSRLAAGAAQASTSLELQRNAQAAAAKAAEAARQQQLADTESARAFQVAQGKRQQEYDLARMGQASQIRKDELEYGLTTKQKLELDRLAEAEADLMASPDFSDEEKREARRQIAAKRAQIEPIQKPRKPTPAELFAQNTHRDPSTGVIFSLDENGKFGKPIYSPPEKGMTWSDAASIGDKALAYARDRAAARQLANKDDSGEPLQSDIDFFFNRVRRMRDPGQAGQAQGSGLPPGEINYSYAPGTAPIDNPGIERFARPAPINDPGMQDSRMQGISPAPTAGGQAQQASDRDAFYSGPSAEKALRDFQSSGKIPDPRVSAAPKKPEPTGHWEDRYVNPYLPTNAVPDTFVGGHRYGGGPASGGGEAYRGGPVLAGRTWVDDNPLAVGPQAKAQVDGNPLDSGGAYAAAKVRDAMATEAAFQEAQARADEANAATYKNQGLKAKPGEAAARPESAPEVTHDSARVREIGSEIHRIKNARPAGRYLSPREIMDLPTLEESLEAAESVLKEAASLRSSTAGKVLNLVAPMSSGVQRRVDEAAQRVRDLENRRAELLDHMATLQQRQKLAAEIAQRMAAKGL